MLLILDAEHEVDFQPSIDIPALQFFEGVDKTGMAMKAGLKPGDFLLEINGIDVRCASHAQVVELIHQSDETITLKVITIEKGFDDNYRNSFKEIPLGDMIAGGTIHGGRKGERMIYAGGLPPMPPQRNPVTSVMFSQNTFSANAYAGKHCFFGLFCCL